MDWIDALGTTGWGSWALLLGVVILGLLRYTCLYTVKSVLFLREIEYSYQDPNFEYTTMLIHDKCPEWGVFLSYKRFPWSKRQSSMVVVSKKKDWETWHLGLDGTTGEELIVPRAAKAGIDREVARLYAERILLRIQSDIDAATSREMRSLGIGN